VIKRATVPLPKPQKSHKMLIETLKTPNPTATLMNQWEKDHAAYNQVLSMADALKQRMAEVANGTFDPRPVVRSLDRMVTREQNTAGATLNGREALGVEINYGAVDMRTMVSKKFIVRSPRVQFTLTGPRGSKRYEAMIDTGAEANILPTSIARDLGGVIFSVNRYKMTTVTGEDFGFAGYAVLRVEIAEGVGCEDAFFLVDGAPKILLGQPFVGKMKMNIEHNSDGSWDGVFIDPEDSRSSCTVMIVPPVKQAVKGPRAKYEQPRVAELTDSEDGDDEEGN